MYSYPRCLRVDWGGGGDVGVVIPGLCDQAPLCGGD